MSAHTSLQAFHTSRQQLSLLNNTISLVEFSNAVLCLASISYVKIYVTTAATLGEQMVSDCIMNMIESIRRSQPTHVNAQLHMM